MGVAYQKQGLGTPQANEWRRNIDHSKAGFVRKQNARSLAAMRNLLLVLKAVNAKSVGRGAFGPLIEICFPHRLPVGF